MSGAFSFAYIAFVGLTAILVGVALASIAVPRARAAGRGGVVAAAIVGLAALVVRSLLAGHLPIFGTFENTLTAAWVLLAAAAAATPHARYRDVWTWAAPWALALLVYGMRFRSDAVPLTISEQSLFVDVHVVFAWVAFASLLAASTLSGLRLAGRHPLGLDDDEADVLLTRLLLSGFLALSAMLALGSFYLYVLFGTFWKWEIVEILSLIVWLGYGLILHLRLFYRRRGAALDMWVVLLLPVLVLAFWVWSVFPGTFHFFDIPLVRPY